jgi:hypothetical protein
MNPKKERVITIRLTDEENEILSAIAKQTKSGKSELVRKAVGTYFDIFLKIPGRTGDDHLIFNIEMQKILLDRADDETIRLLAESSFHICMNADFVDLVLNPDVKNGANPDNFEHQLKMLATYAFSSRGQNWFDNVTYSRKGLTFTFGGQHRLGINFSKFIFYLMKNFGEYYQYIPTDPTIIESERVLVTLIHFTLSEEIKKKIV